VAKRIESIPKDMVQKQENRTGRHITGKEQWGEWWLSFVDFRGKDLCLKKL
jgi:hypothetical protein